MYDQPSLRAGAGSGQTESFPIQFVNQPLGTTSAHLSQRCDANLLYFQVIDFRDDVTGFAEENQVGGPNLAFILFPACMAPDFIFDRLETTDSSNSDGQEQMAVVFTQQTNRKRMQGTV